MPLALFFLKIALGIWDLLLFHTNFSIVCSISLKKCHWKFERDCTESVDCFGWYGHINNISFSNP